jgi:hypothetical protein
VVGIEDGAAGIGPLHEASGVCGELGKAPVVMAIDGPVLPQPVHRLHMVGETEASGRGNDRFHPEHQQHPDPKGPRLLRWLVLEEALSVPIAKGIDICGQALSVSWRTAPNRVLLRWGADDIMWEPTSAISSDENRIPHAR